MASPAEATATFTPTAAQDQAWVVVPVRSLGSGKQRLAGCLTAEQRHALCAAMLEDVLQAVRQARGVAGLLVVSTDASLLRRLAQHLVELHVQTGSGGLNGAVTEAAQLLRQRGAATMLVLHGDLPAVTPSEIERLLALHRRGPGAHLTLVPDGARQGTNLLAASPPNAIPFAYGAGSFQAHCHLAHARGMAVQVMHSAALALDIDTPADLAELKRQCAQQAPLAHSHTGQWLATLDQPVTLVGAC